MRKSRFLFLVLVLLLVARPASATPGNILPWRSGTTATYGPLGVHDCGFSLSGWKAVDLLPAENQVYASAAGQVNYVCRDGNQVALRIGSNLYDHLVDTGQKVGDFYAQGQNMGAMVTGSFNTACGYADQAPNHYHVHFCFIPDGNGFYADGYTLNTLSGQWTKDGIQVGPNGTLTASWAGSGGGGGGGGSGNAGLFNFWDWLVSGLISIATWFINGILPPGTDQQDFNNLFNFTAFFGSAIWAVLELTWAALSMFNWWFLGSFLLINGSCFGIQLAVSLWQFFKSLVSLPFLSK